jgi:tetratricopeptide (TPR) repeat protein
MLRFIISTAFFLVIALLSYNYFFGSAEEKEQAQEIFSKGAEVVGAGAGLLKSEYQKYQEGKYDEALENVSHLLGKLKEQGGDLLVEIESWKQKKNDWEQKKNDLRQLLDADPDAIDGEKVKRAIVELEKERKILESEGNRLTEKAE